MSPDAVTGRVRDALFATKSLSKLFIADRDSKPAAKKKKKLTSSLARKIVFRDVL